MRVFLIESEVPNHNVLREFRYLIAHIASTRDLIILLKMIDILHAVNNPALLFNLYAR